MVLPPEFIAERQREKEAPEASCTASKIISKYMEVGLKSKKTKTRLAMQSVDAS